MPLVGDRARASGGHHGEASVGRWGVTPRREQALRARLRAILDDGWCPECEPEDAGCLPASELEVWIEAHRRGAVAEVDAELAKDGDA